jgi:hypothetical protein
MEVMFSRVLVGFANSVRGTLLIAGNTIADVHGDTSYGI